MQTSTPSAQRSAPRRAVELSVLARRAAMLAAFLEDDGRTALAIAARNLAAELDTTAAALRRSQLRRVA